MPTPDDILKNLNEWLEDQVFMHTGLRQATFNQLLEMDTEEPHAQATVDHLERDILYERHMEIALRLVKDKIERLSK
jgi:hypothetical protein